MTGKYELTLTIQSGEDEEKDSSPEIITTSKDGDDRPSKRRKKNKSQQGIKTRAAFTSLCITHDGQHLIATTGEDKSVLVFRIEDSGSITLLSRR